MNRELIKCTIEAIESVPSLGRGSITSKCALYYLAHCAGLTNYTHDYDVMGNALGDQKAITELWETNDWVDLETGKFSPEAYNLNEGNKEGVLALLRSWLVD